MPGVYCYEDAGVTSLLEALGHLRGTGLLSMLPRAALKVSTPPRHLGDLIVSGEGLSGDTRVAVLEVKAPLGQPPWSYAVDERKVAMLAALCDRDELEPLLDGLWLALIHARADPREAPPEGSLDALLSGYAASLTTLLVPARCLPCGALRDAADRGSGLRVTVEEYEGIPVRIPVALWSLQRLGPRVLRAYDAAARRRCCDTTPDARLRVEYEGVEERVECRAYAYPELVKCLGGVGRRDGCDPPTPTLRGLIDALLWLVERGDEDLLRSILEAVASPRRQLLALIALAGYVAAIHPQTLLRAALEALLRRGRDERVEKLLELLAGV